MDNVDLFDGNPTAKEKKKNCSEALRRQRSVTLAAGAKCAAFKSDIGS